MTSIRKAKKEQKRLPVQAAETIRMIVDPGLSLKDLDNEYVCDDIRGIEGDVTDIDRIILYGRKYCNFVYNRMPLLTTHKELIDNYPLYSSPTLIPTAWLKPIPAIEIN